MITFQFAVYIEHLKLSAENCTYEGARWGVPWKHNSVRRKNKQNCALNLNQVRFWMDLHHYWKKMWHRCTKCEHVSRKKHVIWDIFICWGDRQTVAQALDFQALTANFSTFKLHLFPHKLHHMRLYLIFSPEHCSQQSNSCCTWLVRHSNLSSRLWNPIVTSWNASLASPKMGGKGFIRSLCSFESITTFCCLVPTHFLLTRKVVIVWV